MLQAEMFKKLVSSFKCLVVIYIKRSLLISGQLFVATQIYHGQCHSSFIEVSKHFLSSSVDIVILEIKLIKVCHN